MLITLMMNLNMFGGVTPPPIPPIPIEHTPLIDEATLKEFEGKRAMIRKKIDETNDDIIIIIASWLESKKRRDN